MINEPVRIVDDDFQTAWREATLLLMKSQWELRNLVVQIRNPSAFAVDFHEEMSAFSKREKLLSPKDVAYTIFPEHLGRTKGNAKALIHEYNRKRGFYDRTKTQWGTYFRRMTKYETPSGDVNQLQNIIDALRQRHNVSKAAYTMIVQKPGGETVRPLGGPCLNYVAVQVGREEKTGALELGLLAVYRNHDFLRRAYGNYWGLCNLLRFLAREVDATPSALTCISSHAYVDQKKAVLKQFLKDL